MGEADMGGEPVVLTVAEAAVICRVSRSVLYESIRTGRIAAIRISERRLVVPRAALIKLLSGESEPDTGRKVGP